MSRESMNIEKMKVKMCTKCFNMFQHPGGGCSACGNTELETFWTSTDDDGDYLFKLVSHVGDDQNEEQN